MEITRLRAANIDMREGRFKLAIEKYQTIQREMPELSASLRLNIRISKDRREGARRDAMKVIETVAFDFQKFQNSEKTVEIWGKEFRFGSFIWNAYSIINEAEIEVVSFDYFDTLVYRSVHSPQDIFEILAEYAINKGLIHSNISPPRFRLIRRDLEKSAREAAKNNEVTLNEIYKDFAFMAAGHSIQELIDAEIYVEKNNINPVIPVLWLAREAKRLGKKVIILSDTYFSSSDLRSFLPIGFDSIFDHTFCSSELRHGKGSGSFDRVLAELGVSAARMAHFGDNYIADVQIPSISGIRTFLLPSGTTEINEIRSRELELFISRNRGSKLGPISPLFTHELKAAHHFNVSHTWSHFSWGMYTLGPILAAFVNWVGNCVRIAQTHRIMPVMREGHLLGQIFSIICPDLKNLNPAYLSRKVLFKATIEKLTTVEIDFAFGNAMANDLSSSLDLLNLSQSDINNFLDSKGETLNDERNVDFIKRLVINNPALSKISALRSKMIRNGLIEHLSIDGDIKDEPVIVLVDLGWNGTIQRLLRRCFDLEGITTRIDGYYLMTTAAVNYFEVAETNRTHGFLVNGGFPELDFRLLSRNLEILEQSCIPDHGSVTGYKADGRPLFSSSQLPREQLDQIADIQDGALEYSRLFRCLGLYNYTVFPDYVEYLRCKLARAMQYPTDFEVKLFDNWWHDDNLFGSELRAIIDTAAVKGADCESIGDILRIPMTKVYWVAGSLAKFNQSLAMIIMYCSHVGIDCERLRFHNADE